MTIDEIIEALPPARRAKIRQRVLALISEAQRHPIADLTPTCPKTGHPMFRDVRPKTLSHKGWSATVAMPGWYCDASDESIHTGDDMKASDEALENLKLLAAAQSAPMTLRKRFDVGDDEVDIVMQDGELWIEASSDYGDSEAGWGATTKTIHLSREKVSEFMKFLMDAALLSEDLRPAGTADKYGVPRAEE